ncbi:MAG: NAD(P)H-quinone oxidoreductase [Rhizobiaceae bacterium]|nr:NAD(P)H-quinone oxidoreductase [Rhizobiaceae bacterium]
MRTIETNGTGGPEVLELGERARPEIADNQILAKTIACGVNGPDMMQRKGLYPPPPGASDLMGLEVSGTVELVGKNVTRWKKGDTICALTHGGAYAEYVAINADHCLAIPEGVSTIDAAGLPETYFTVWSNLFYNREIAKGAKLLVHGGSGGIGITAVQLGAALGMEVYATASNAEKCAFCESHGATRGINYKEEDFVEVMKSAGGADLILDILGGDYIARNFKAAALDGRIVQLAYRSGSKVQIDMMPLMLKRLTFHGSTLRARPDAFKAAIATDLEKHVWPMFAKGQCKPLTHATFSFDEASAAHQMMENAGHVGKIILTA